MPKFRRKPTVIEAEQFRPNEIGRPIPRGVFKRLVPDPENDRIVYVQFYVITIHGQETDVVDGDYILPEPDGEHFYPCKPDIFEATYESVGGDDPAKGYYADDVDYLKTK